MEQQPPTSKIVQKAAALTVRDAAQYTGTSRSRLYAEVRAGRLTPRKSGRRTLFLTSELDSWLYSLPTIGAA